MVAELPVASPVRSSAGLYRERLPALGDSGRARELVLLHGWGSASDIWRGALPLLRRHFNITLIDLPGHGRSGAGAFADPDDFIDTLLPQLPPRAVYLGWSLGGMLATRLAARHSRRVSALITLCTNAVFVAQKDWPRAMAPQTFNAFRKNTGQAPAKSLKRFRLLQARGDENEKAQLRQSPPPAINPADREALIQGLDWLEALDNRDALAALSLPALHVLGENDALVPAAVAGELTRLNGGHRVAVLARTAHLPFASKPDELWSLVLDFLDEHGLKATAAPAHIDKSAVARSFSRAAATYDGVADLQRRVADRAAALLPAPTAAETLVDLGCGTGYSVPALKRRDPAGQVIGLDLAEGMLRYARAQLARRADTWLCADGEDLPLADESVDRLFSSLSVQWCENIGAVFAEAYRVLKPGGGFTLSTLGPATLNELRAAWQAVDGYVHVNRFADRETIERAVARSGLRLRGWQETREILHYRDLRQLMNELKQLGAHNLNSGRPGGLTGRQRLRRFAAAYEAFRDAEGRLPSTYQVWYLQLEK